VNPCLQERQNQEVERLTEEVGAYNTEMRAAKTNPSR
jgi:hypothetical protein